MCTFEEILHLCDVAGNVLDSEENCSFSGCILMLTTYEPYSPKRTSSVQVLTPNFEPCGAF